MLTIKRLAPRIAVFLPLLIPLAARAGAIDIPQQGARAGGQGEAFAAQADDPSAIFYNPAGLTQLQGTNAMAGSTLFLPDWEFDADNGDQTNMRLPSLLPYVYTETDFGLENFRFGLGVNNTFGLNEEWGHRGPVTPLVEQSHLFTFNLAPSVAWQITDYLSVGVDLDIYWGDIELSRSVPLGAGMPTGHFHYRGQDAAIGTTPGIMWKIDDRNTIAAVYRSPFDMGYSGDARVKTRGLPEVGPSHTHVDLNFPQMATLAYAMRPIKPLKLETDIVWTDWSTVRETTLSSSNPAFNQVIKDDWKSGFSFRFGVQYDLTQQWALRAGYAYGQDAVPADTFSPLVPDSNYHLFSVGVGYKLNDHLDVDAAYQFIFRENRHISGGEYAPTVDGTWKNNFNVLMLGATLTL